MPLENKPISVTVVMTFDDYEYTFGSGMFVGFNFGEQPSREFIFERQPWGWQQIGGTVISGIDGSDNQMALLERLNAEYDKLCLESDPTILPATRVFGFDTMLGKKVLVE